MGNTLLASHDDVVHVRGWTREQIGTVFNTLRRKNSMYCLTKDDYMRFFGGRNREAASIFNDLDTDIDGKVDIFEMFMVLALFSGTVWEEKQHILFELFDMMGKGFLKIDEVMLFGSVLVNTLRKFVKLDPTLGSPESLKSFSHEAFPANKTQIEFEHFRSWFNASNQLVELKGFLEDHAARGQPDSNESRVKVEINAFEKHAAKLFERIEKLQDRLPVFSDGCIEYVAALGRRKRWEFVMQNLRQLVLKLHGVSETMHTMLAALGESLNEDVRSGGLASVVKPHQRFQQEQMLIDLRLLQQQSATDYREVASLVLRLIELTESNELETSPSIEDVSRESLTMIREEEGDDVSVDISPPRVMEKRIMMKQLYDKMAADIEADGIFGHTKQTALALSTQATALKDALPSVGAVARDHLVASDVGAHADPASAAFSEESPTLVAIADLDPPLSHQGQMLKLSVGDMVTVLGQDGRGWWYGRKTDGKEGWFPPSYVQLKSAHFSQKAGS